MGFVVLQVMCNKELPLWEMVSALFGLSKKKRPDLARMLPWIEDDIAPGIVINEFAFLDNGVKSASDWEAENEVIERGMHTRIDTGRPTWFAEVMIISLAFLNASLGTIHRWSIESMDDDQSTWNEDMAAFAAEHGQLAVAHQKFAVTVITMSCSWLVFRTMFCVAFQWYTVLTFMKQLSSVLSIDRAVVDHL